MKYKTILIVGGVMPTLLLTSCGYSTGYLNRATSHARQQGIAEGRAMQVRQVYHEEQRELESPYQPAENQHPLLPPLTNERRFYEVPIPEHTATDGVMIEAHTQKIQVLQP